MDQAAGFEPVTIAGVPRTTAAVLPQFSLQGFEWRIYRRAL
jgi:hypothetical protein